MTVKVYNFIIPLYVDSKLITTYSYTLMNFWFRAYNFYNQREFEVYYKLSIDSQGEREEWTEKILKFQ